MSDSLYYFWSCSLTENFSLLDRDISGEACCFCLFRELERDDIVVPEYIWGILNESLWFHPNMEVDGLGERINEPVNSLFLSSRRRQSKAGLCLYYLLCVRWSYSFLPSKGSEVTENVCFIEGTLNNLYFLSNITTSVLRKWKIINSSQ